MKNKSYDVVVIGAGFAGLAAAIEAAESGLTVIVLEKMKAPGGNSVISDGGIAAPETEYQQKNGIEDSVPLFFEDMKRAAKGYGNDLLLKTVAGKAKEAFYWTKDHLGVEYMDRVDIFGGHSVPRCYTPVGLSGSMLIKKQVKKLKELQTEIRYGCYVKEILVDNEGKVSGVAFFDDYRYPDHEHKANNKFYARKGIVVAAGGFGADVEFRMKFDNRLDKSVQTTNKLSSTAEMVKSSMAIGASVVDLEKIQLGPWASPDEYGFGNGPLFADYIALPYGILVNPETGKRFTNELSDRGVLSEAILAQKNPVIGIADQKAVTQSGWDIQKAIDKKVVKVFSDFKTLALEYDIEISELESAIAEYNQMIDNGIDKQFGKSFPKGATPISQPPFYAMRLWPKVHYSMGGLVIDHKARVLDQKKNPISGLYAAGEVTGGIHGAARLGSCAITDCIVMGRIAGTELAGAQ